MDPDDLKILDAYLRQTQALRDQQQQAPTEPSQAELLATALLEHGRQGTNGAAAVGNLYLQLAAARSGAAGASGEQGGDAPSACPAPPLAPPGVSVDQNMREAEQHGANWYYDQVRNKGPWDYKQQGRQYQDFGNFNYGATAAAWGFPHDVIQRMAGWAQQRSGTSRPEWQGPLGSYPYGDDPADQRMIDAGITYHDNGCR